jgi:type III restriction enzyme
MAKNIKLKFESNQEHQNIAVNSVIDLFDGFTQSMVIDEFNNDIASNIDSYCNFEESWLLDNLMEVQTKNNIPLNFGIDIDDGATLEIDGYDTHRFPCFTIEMETGTGKTYAYIKTIFELNKKYGFRKFIIVVPSVAIYEGVYKSIEITKEHFKTLYGNVNFSTIKYDGQQIGKVKDFAINPYITIMIMTIDSFNGKTNNIYKATEKLPGEKKPYQYIQETKPIFILDESQNYLSSKSREALRTFNPLFALNYSATPKEKPNLIYRLRPLDAFKLNLVKKIQVEGVTEQHNLNDKGLNIIIDDVIRNNNAIHASVKAHCVLEGQKQIKTITLRKNDDLFEKTNNEDFLGFVVEDINFLNKQIIFTNGSVLGNLQTEGITLSKSEIFRVQIEQTIRYHFERQKILRNKGIKVLSLFFIDKVDNYVQENGIIKTIFDNAFNRLKHLDSEFKKLRPEEVRQGYFAKKKINKTTEAFTDTAIEESAKSKEDKESEKAAYDLIMKNKELLLNFNEKVSFIFAHSALREGWDNPNVFQICTLNTATSENRKRQEIGRGLRLAVNQDGDRVQEEGVNVLTVIANEHYEEYVDALQKEYRESGDTPPTKPTKPRKSIATRNDKVFFTNEFKAFWNKLAQKTDYVINIDSTKIINDCNAVFKSPKTTFPESKIIISRGKFVMTTFEFKLNKVSVDLAQIDIKITDSENLENTIKGKWYKIGHDFGKKLSKRLSGYKIVEIKEYASDSIVHFGNGESITLESNIYHNDNKGFSNDDIIRQEAQTSYPVFNLIDRTSKETGLTRPTIFQIFKSIPLDKKELIFKNPEGFANKFIEVVKDVLADNVAQGIEYKLNNDLEEYDYDEMFPPKKDFPQKELVNGSENSLYDFVQIDSGVEERFVNNILIEDDEDGNIIAYFKFPPSFKVKIPKVIKNYNPDWGIIRKNKDGISTINLVRETKGSLIPEQLQWPSEKRKIKCAIKHFETLGINYRQITGETIKYWEKSKPTKNYRLDLELDSEKILYDNGGE